MPPAGRATTDEPIDEIEDDELEKPIKELSDLHRMSVPERFEVDLTETIRKRSGGRFFGPKRLADRVPFLWLAIAALIIGLVIFFMLWSSDTGSLRYQRKPSKPAVHPEAPQQMPSPYE